MPVTAAPAIPGPRCQSRSSDPDPSAFPNDPRPRSTSGKIRVFLVEDHPATARALQTLLKIRRCAVEVASDMRSALELASKIEFDVLVCDLNLPDGTGWELLVKLGKKGRECAIAYSAFDEPQHLVRSRQAGFVEHLAKGTDADELLAAIDRIAQGKRRTAEPSTAKSRRSPPRPPGNRAR